MRMPFDMLRSPLRAAFILIAAALVSVAARPAAAETDWREIFAMFRRVFSR